MNTSDLELFFADWHATDVALISGAFLLSLAMAFFAWKSRRNYLRLPELPVDTTPAASLTAIVPARNEEANIARVVGSFPANHVLVVDDFSTDRTSELAREAGAYVMQPPPLKRGVAGKNNACFAGAEAVKTDWMLFVDADTWYRPEFAPSLVNYAKQANLALTTVFLKQECVTVWEKMILPYAFALYFCGVNAKQVNALSSSESLANGQCMLWKRSAYEFVGGHNTVATSVIEDVELARLAKRHQQRLRVLRAEKLGSVRMYDGLGAIWRGFQKNAFRFLVVNPATGFQVVLASIVMASWLPMLAALMLNQLWIAAALFYFVPTLVFASWYGGIFQALLAPYAIYFFQAIALNAMISTTFNRRTLWKGRAV
ncbi:MAG: glycosyltransferase [Bryobacteraceae bacterium]|nr:glycosyltransferase [Bryobacteraceae bacterium]